MSNILVTGGAGYIGSHIVELLIKRRIKVIIVDNLSTGFKKLINNKAKFYKLDIFNKEKLKKIILRHNVKSVFHMAASVSVGLGEKFPKKYFKNNVGGTVSLLNACKSMGVKNFIFSSTAAVYKDGLSKVNEKSKKNPKSVYGKTKLKAENKIVKCCKKYKINYGILRYFNIVGASPSNKIGLINKNDHLFKNFATETLKKKPVLKVYGSNYNTHDGSCIRDFIHVSDIAEIHLKVLEKINKVNQSKILNCGYNKGTSVLEVAKEFKKHSKKDIKIINLPKRKGDLAKIIADNKKLHQFIKWQPKYNVLKTMVKSSINWEKKLIKN
jgi:UDP-glucose 4-epimerase